MERFEANPFQEKPPVLEKSSSEESVQKESIKEKFEDRFEREGFGNIERVVVRGSVPLALMSGRSLELARDIDIFFIEGGFEPKMSVKDFNDLSQAKEELPSSAFELIERFVMGHGLEHMPLQVVHVTENLMREASLFRDEPEAVLWDSSLEIKKQLFKPISASQKEELLRKLQGFSGDSWVVEGIKKNAQEAQDQQLYQEGKLYRGGIPSFLKPSGERLAAALRLVDLGRRFDIPADDYFLQVKDMKAKEGTIMLALPIGHGEEVAFKEEEASKEGYRHEFQHEFQIENSGAIDVAFCNVARKEGIRELLAQKYPHLAAVAKRIEEAGGLREFVKKEYGEVYLERDSVSLDAPSFAGYGLSLFEQHIILDAWEYNSPQQIFGEDAKSFIDACYELNKTSQISGFSGESLTRAVLNLRLESLGASSSMKDREQAYRIMGFFLEEMHYRVEPSADHENLKEKIKEAFLKERSTKLRKILIEDLARLASRGDLAIVSDLADVVKKEGTRLKVEKAMKDSGEVLDSEGMNALRALFAFQHRDAQKVIFELMANPKVDKRLKKACLLNLTNQKAFFYDKGMEDSVRGDLRKDSRIIPWEDYAGIWRVENIASSAVRERLLSFTGKTFSDIRRGGESMSEVKNDIAAKLPWEFFLTLYTLSNGNTEQIKAWEKIIVGTKSNKLRESFLYSIANFPAGYFRLLTEKLIQASEVTKEHILLADRLIKKIHFLDMVEQRRSAAGTAQEESLMMLLKQAKEPSLFEIKLDEKIVEGLSRMTERGDLTSSKVHSLFQAWENPEPFLVYLTALASRSEGDKDTKKTLRLVGEMLVHVDPEKMTEWKQWRYDRANPIVEEQLRDLSDKQVEAYAGDEFVDLGEVLVGLLPNDKPERIQQEIFHAVQHDWPTAGVLEAQAITRFFHNIQAVAEGGGKFNAEQVLMKDIEKIEQKKLIIKEWLDLEEDERLSKGLAEKLFAWQRNEAQKAKRLIELGYRGDESAQEINNIIVRMKSAKEDKKKISAISNLQPNPLSPQTQALLDRRGVSVNASPEDIEAVQKSIRADVEKMQNSEEFVALRQELFGEREVSFNDWRGVIKDLRMAQLFLRLGTLSPQLIAFNKISPEKKKASLQSAIDSLKDNFQGNRMVVETIKRVQEIINEESHPAGRDHLAVIFTDNPLAMFSIGKFPTGAESCQHYRNGDIALGAYAADASTKMILLVDLDKLSSELQSELGKAEDSASRLEIFKDNTESFLNASVGRRITKIVHDRRTAEPQLFLEPVYTSLNRESTTRILNAFAIAHLKSKLGIEVVRGGGKGEVIVPKSRNHFQYEDGEEGGPGGGGGGLGLQSGSYVMSAQSLKDADYLVRV